MVENKIECAAKIIEGSIGLTQIFGYSYPLLTDEYAVIVFVFGPYSLSIEVLQDDDSLRVMVAEKFDYDHLIERNLSNEPVLKKCIGKPIRWMCAMEDN